MRLDGETLRNAYLSAWGWGKEMTLSPVERHGAILPPALYGRLDRRLTAARRLR